MAAKLILNSSTSNNMIEPLEDIPEYIEQEVQDRIAAGASGTTLIVDDSEREFLLAYTDFTRTLKEKYNEACEERGEDNIKVYQLKIDISGVQVTRYESAKGMNSEAIWRGSVQ